MTTLIYKTLKCLTASLPVLEDLQKNEGEAGRRKIAQITRYVSLGWGFLQSIIFSLILRQYAVQGISDTTFVLQTSIALVTGSMIVMWFSEIITEKGIGQGASLVIFLNIVATLPKALSSTIEKAQTGDRADVLGIAVLLGVFLLTIVGIIFVQEGARRIPIVSAKRQIGSTTLLPTRQSYLPLKLNAGGVMPIIFASALIFLPITIANVTGNPILIKLASSLNPSSSNPWPYALTFFALILGFSYFYREPKKFEGGELIFPKYDYSFECKNNSLIMMPGWVEHGVSKVSIHNSDYFDGYGRYAITSFFSNRERDK